MAFTKRDYQQLADVVQLCDEQEQGEDFHAAIVKIAFSLCESFHDAPQNKAKHAAVRFDPKKFLLACGMSDEDVAQYYMLRGSHNGTLVS